MKLKTALLLVKEKSTFISFSLALATAAAVGTALFLYLFNAHLANFRSEHNVVLSAANQLLNERLGDIRNSTVLMNAHIVDVLSDETSSADIETIFARVGKVLPSISQMRWLSLNGQEQALSLIHI